MGGSGDYGGDVVHGVGVSGGAVALPMVPTGDCCRHRGRSRRRWGRWGNIVLYEVGWLGRFSIAKVLYIQCESIDYLMRMLSYLYRVC